MAPTYLLLLGLGMLVPSADGPSSAADIARWREMLLDRHAPPQQSQAALLLVSSREPEAVEIVRQGLRRTETPEVFIALCAALRTTQEARYHEELLSALTGPQVGPRQAAAETLAVLASAEVLQRLHGLAEDAKNDPGIRQTAAWTLGRSGRKQAAGLLIGLLVNDSLPLRKAVIEALTELTGQPFDTDQDRWRTWWERTRELPNDRWLEDRLAFHASRTRRLEGDLDRTRKQLLRLQGQLYARLPAADRLSHVQSLLDQEDPAVRALAVPWSVEQLAGADALRQRALADVLLRLSQDGTLEIQRAAVLALGRVSDDRALERLQQLLEKAPASTRAAAALGLAQQARAHGAEAPVRQKQIVPLLQKALHDPAVEVVIEAAEALGSLGVAEASPVLASLLRHTSQPVRQTAAQALERVADMTVLDALLEGLDDASVSVRFSLLGALAHAAPESAPLSEMQRDRLLARLESALLRDADAGVRSRAATALGDCAGAAALATLWKRVQAGEDARVQEKSWDAMVDAIARAGNLPVLCQWDRVLAEAKQTMRRTQLLTEVHGRWGKREEARPLADSALELLVQAHLDQGKWTAAFPHIRDLLTRSSNEADLDRRLRWLLAVGDQALREGNQAEALRVVQEAQLPLTRRGQLASEFQRLEKQARQ